MKALGVGFALGAAMLTSVGAAQAQQVFKVGGFVDSAPWSFRDAKTNAQQGIMVDLLTAIGKDAGISFNFETTTTTAERIPALLSNQIDILGTNVQITPDRQAQGVAFSDVFWFGGDTLVVLKSDTTNYKAYADLKGETICTVAASVYDDGLRKAGVFKEVKLFPTSPECLADVAAGKSKAAINSLAQTYLISRNDFPQLRVVNSYQPGFAGPFGIGVRKTDTDLLAKINKSLAKLMGDGTLKVIFAKYGVDWAPPPKG